MLHVLACTTGYSNTSYIVYYEPLDPHVWCPAMEDEFDCFRGDTEQYWS